MPALPSMLMRPRVMPRPIHLTFLSVAVDLELVAGFAFDGEEVVDAALAACPDRPAARGSRRSSAPPSMSGREHLRFERDGRLLFERERDHAGSERRVTVQVH